MYLGWIPDYNQYMSIDEVGNEEADIVWRYSACNANRQLKFIQTRVSFSLKDKTVFFFLSFYSVVNMYFEYISLCFVLNLINLFNAYILLFLRVPILFY